ncbi:MAG TPA: peptidylprolyl isomerase [Planctomycetota bacterium]|nr:peptidylprolyl isomerase [Planctomycetota bacterium]HPF14941.1 peptidylprolyl isomerase [Planctomycetota bacterium]HRV80417.1 peptidylprolyl isomerase [Planctomycetota bacterium]
MAKHKSATQVTVVTEERSAIQRWVDRNWGKALLLGGVVAAGIVINHYRNTQVKTARADEWNPLLEAEGDFAKTMAAAENEADPQVKGWGYALAAREGLIESNEDEAAEALGKLAAMPDHFLNSNAFPAPGGNGETLAKQAYSAIQKQIAWDKEHASAFTNPDPDPGSPVVVIKTAEGDIEVTLYERQAPKHVENFLKLVDEHFYDGILFHRTVKSPGLSIIQAGDPNTKESDTTQWGQGGPGYSIKAENNGLMNVEGVLSAAMPPNSSESSGSQFFITLGAAHHLDGRHTVFGKVTAGMDVARKIQDAPVRDPEAGQTDIPVNPVAIQTIERK